MKKTILLIMLTSLFGCISVPVGPAFEPLEDACSPINKYELSSICGYESILKSNIGGSFCMYSSPNAGTYEDQGPFGFLTVSYISSSKSYEELKSEVPKLFGADAVIEDNVGLGDNSFLVKVGESQKTLVVFVKGSSIKVDLLRTTDNNELCFKDEQIKQIGELALHKMGLKDDLSFTIGFESPNCSDTDNGLDIYAYGTATAPHYSRADECSDELTVREMYCSIEGNPGFEYVQCPEGYACFDGACIESNEPQPEISDYSCTTTSVFDSEMTRLFTKQETVVSYTENGERKEETYWNECTGLLQGYHMMKEYFCSQGRLGSQNIACPENYSCSDGACVQME